MDIKFVKYWRIELFDAPATSSISSLCKGVVRLPFFTGYAEEPLNLRKIQDDKYLTLFCEPASAETHSFLADRVHEIKCLPVYENEATFLDAANPLIKWLSENVHPHHSVIVTATGAELLEGKVIHRTDEYLKD